MDSETKDKVLDTIVEIVIGTIFIAAVLTATEALKRITEL